MTVAFISWCPECFEKVRYVHGRPSAHECTANNEESGNDDA